MLLIIFFEFKYPSPIKNIPTIITTVIGYALGSAAPMLFLYNFGPKIRKEFPNGLTLTEYIKKRFGLKILKISLFLILFYLIIFLIAEVTAIAFLLNFISKIPLWRTSAITLIICLLYILKGGFKLSIITDKYQFSFILIIIILSILMILGNLDLSSYELIKKRSPNLISRDYIPNYTSGLTFFIAVAATNLFHQGNWQRVFAAKSNSILKLSLIISSALIIPIVFLMGFSGLLSISKNPEVIPDLAFFLLILKQQNVYISIVIILLAISLTISSIDTLMNAISSLIIVDGKNIINTSFNFVYLSKIIIILLSSIAFIIASKGLSILYLFLLADLFCCAAAVTTFYNFYKKIINQKTALFSIMIGLISGLLFFPNTNFSASLLVGGILPSDYFPLIITNNLLFLSFFTSTLFPVLFWRINFK